MGAVEAEVGGRVVVAPGRRLPAGLRVARRAGGGEVEVSAVVAARLPGGAVAARAVGGGWDLAVLMASGLAVEGGVAAVQGEAGAVVVKGVVVEAGGAPIGRGHVVADVTGGGEADLGVVGATVVALVTRNAGGRGVAGLVVRMAGETGRGGVLAGERVVGRLVVVVPACLLPPRGLVAAATVAADLELPHVVMGAVPVAAGAVGAQAGKLGTGVALLAVEGAVAAFQGEPGGVVDEGCVRPVGVGRVVAQGAVGRKAGSLVIELGLREVGEEKAAGEEQHTAVHRRSPWWQVMHSWLVPRAR